MGGLAMKWYEIVIAVATAFGGIEAFKWLYSVIFNRKNNSRIANTEATNAEIEVEKNKAIAEAEAKKALEEAHTVERKQYEERISDLHKTIDKLNAQLDGYVERDESKEKRFDEQTAKLRDVQRKLLEETQIDIEYEKRIASLELTIERVKCNRRLCPFRQPPTADTPAYDGRDINEYFKDSENDTAKG